MRTKVTPLKTKESIIQFGHGLGSSEVVLFYPTLRWDWGLCSACGSVASHECWIRSGGGGGPVKAPEQLRGISMKSHHPISGQCGEWYNLATLQHIIKIVYTKSQQGAKKHRLFWTELQRSKASRSARQCGKKLMIGLVSYHSCQDRCERSQSRQLLISSNCREANKSLIRVLACEWRVRDGRRKPGKMRGILEQGWK